MQLGDVVETGLLGDTIRAVSTEHGALVVQRLVARHSGELGARFIEGARNAAALPHRAALPVLAHGVTSEGEAWVAWPALPGESVAELIARRPGRIPPVEALRIVSDALEVLTSAHERGLLHGGLTPHDVLIADDGSVRIRGLGWADVRAEIAQREGSPPLPERYAAPERLATPERAPDEAADLWSMGAILFELLTGESPYAEGRPTRSLTELCADAPIVLVRLVDSALEPEPERRIGALRMRAVARDIAQLPELFLLKNLKSYDAAAPVSGPRRSPSAELEQHSPPTKPPSSGVRQPAHPGAITIEFRGELPKQSVPASLVPDDDIPTPIPSARVADTLPAMPRVAQPPSSDRRRRMADVVVGEATASHADVRALSELFARLDAVLESPSAFDDFRAGCQAAIAASRGGLVWNVEPWGFSAGEHAVWEPRDPLVPYRLYRDGIRSLGMLPGVTSEELDSWVRIVSVDDAELLPEDDRATLLARQRFEHIVFRRADAPPVGTRAILSLATFDTAAQLEDCWRAAHRGAHPNVEPVLAVGAELAEPDERALEAKLAAESMLSAERAARIVEAGYAVATSDAMQHQLAVHGGRVLAAILARDVDRAFALLASLRGSWRELPPEAAAALLTTAGRATTEHLPLLTDLVVELDARHAAALAGVLHEIADPGLAARVEHKLLSGMTGHEAALGELLPTAERRLGLGLCRILASLDTLAARAALARGTENPDALVRIEALGHIEGPSGARLRAELAALLEQAPSEARRTAIDALERHDVRAAAPFLALRARGGEFDKLEPTERRRVLEALATLAPARAEAVALGLLRETRLVSLPAHEESRALAAEILGAVGASEEVRELLAEESQRYFRTSERVRSAAARALEEVERRSVPPTRDEESSG